MEAAEYHSGLRTLEPAHYIDIYNRQGEKIQYVIPKAGGDHGGGDERLLEMLFGSRALPDPLGQQAGSYAGALSLLVGAAANQSIQAGQAIRISDLLPLDQFRPAARRGQSMHAAIPT